jgi:drug/metabolite transporter (DMT)-like permease
MEVFYPMKTYIKLTLTALFWGGTFIAGRQLATSDISPYSMAFFRFSIASAFLTLFCLLSREKLKKINVEQFALLAILGATGVFSYNVFFFKGLKTVLASRAALIIALNPVVISIGSSIFFKEKLSLNKLIGIFISVLGASIIITRGNPYIFFEAKVGLGELCIVGCVLSWSLYSLLGKRVMKDLSPLVSTTYACIIGTIYLFVFALFSGLGNDFLSTGPISWLSLSYLGLFGTALAFMWFFQGVKKIGAQRSAIFINLVPVSGVIFASIFLKESITSVILLGGLLVLTGVFLVNMRTLKPIESH